MSEFSVKSSDLRSNANLLNDYLQKFQKEQGNLTGAEQTLMKGFQGDAAVTFDKNYKELEAKMTNFATVVSEYITKLNEEAEAYDKADIAATNVAGTK